MSVRNDSPPDLVEAKDDPVARAEALAPAIEAASDEAERTRRLPPALLAALHEARLFRLLLPRQFGGEELDPASFMRTIRAIARIDGSTAWCLCQANGCAMSAAFLEPDVARTIWGDDPAGVVAWGPGPKAAARSVDGGYRLDGRWAFVSGGRHATWLGAHVPVIEPDGGRRRGEDGRTEVLTLLYPAARATAFDTWDVIGLRGTGSDDFAVEDLFVPPEHTFLRDLPRDRRIDTPLYRFPMMSLYAAGFAGTAIGLAQSVLEAFIELAKGKTPRLARLSLRDNLAVQADLGRARARLGAGEAFLLAELRAIWRTVVASGELSIDDRIRIRLASTHAIHEAKAVVANLYENAGASAIGSGGTIERRFRDIHTVSQQLQGRPTHFQTVGAYLLGHDADLLVI